ncbi:MAG: FTR1 family iron permease [Deltaproteobacteria bacterium]|nr:FTR1 family iron permease [Deltaproteobacteria bacterium]
MAYSKAAEGPAPAEIEREITLKLESSYRSYTAGDKEAAKALAQDGYMRFEGLEEAIAARSPARMVEIESLFVRVVGGVYSGNSPAAIRADIDELKDKLDFAVILLEKEKGSGAASLFINSMIIILREGFEAMLIISALSAYLIKIGRKDQVRVLYMGGAAALLASFGIALFFYIFLPSLARGSAAFEGVTFLAATAVLVYVSYWLISKVQVVKWQKYIRSKVEGALGNNNVYTMGFASFLAVFREGAETVLFYQALKSSSSGGSAYILSGFGLGVLILAGIFFAFRYGAVKIPIAPFFAVTSTILYYIAFTFAGKGVLELQEAGWVSSTPIKWVPAIGALGIYPSREGLSIQLFMLLAMAVAIVYSLLVNPYIEREERFREVAHVASDISGLHRTLEHIKQHAMLCHELSSEKEGEEVEEIRNHLREIDSKTHEVMDHLGKLEAALSDVFGDMERSLEKHA